MIKLIVVFFIGAFIGMALTCLVAVSSRFEDCDRCKFKKNSIKK